jgi:hypothetical protein
MEAIKANSGMPFSLLNQENQNVAHKDIRCHEAMLSGIQNILSFIKNKNTIQF